MFIGAGAARLVALGGFWILVLIAFLRGEMSLKAIAIFVAFWLLGFVGFRFVLSPGFFLPYVALLDIVLVLAIFKGDVKIY